MNALRASRRRLLARGAWMLSLLLALVVLGIALRTFMVRPSTTVAVLPVPGMALDVERAAMRLGEAIRIRTVSDEQQPDSIRAALEEFRAWLAVTYPALHAVAGRTVVDGGTLLYEWKGADPDLSPIILMAHQDVVPETAPERWQHAPFSGEIAGDSIWGRGSIDNKGSLLAIMEAAEALAAAGHVPARTLMLVFGHDEETTGSGAAAVAALLAERGVRAQFVLDEGSLAIADHPVTAGPVALIGVSEKGYATVRVLARAPGGHSSAPPDETAVGTLARAIDAIMERPFPLRYDHATRGMLEALAPAAPALTRMAIANAWLFRPALLGQMGATPQGAAMLHTTLAPTMLAASPKENVLATEASALVNVRIAPGDTLDSVLAHLRESVRDLPVVLELSGEARGPSPVSATDSAGFQLIGGAVRAVFGVPVAPAPVIAATDSRSMVRISDHIYRFQPLLLPLADTAMIHGIDEHLRIDALERMIRFYGVLLAAGTGDATAANAATSPATIR